MLQCPKDTIIVRLFCNVSSSFFLLFIFFYFTSILLAKLFIFFGGSPFYQRNEEDFTIFSDGEMEEENEYYMGSKLMEEMPNVQSEEGEIFRRNINVSDENGMSEEFTSSEGYDTPPMESVGGGASSSVESQIPAIDTDTDSDANDYDPKSRHETTHLNTSINNFGANDLPDKNTQACGQEKNEREFSKNDQKNVIGMIKLRQEENFLVFQPAKSEGKKLHVQEKDEGEIYGDAFTIGSTSKDSSEWRSSINCRDSGTDDPFSSSSRRSCPNWESYTVFQKYDEEMLFLDRISAQKLQETESLRSIMSCPRSISERIVQKLGTKKTSEIRHNPFRELEAAYVAQICLTWEALNWNYKYFQRLRASRKPEFDPGCPAYVAQHFQQFQVLLQRYIENEPYEHGRRPEIYARMRSLAPKLLQVPEYRDSLDDDGREASPGSRIPSSSFMIIMEEAIRTFMNFMKQDKKSGCQIIAAFFRRSPRASSDANLLSLLKKLNQKKKAKLKELRRSGKCMSLRKRKLKAEEELEILMALIDLKVVSRVLRMADVNGEQLLWCENKMSKVRVSDTKLHRDSSPLFFPAH